MFDALRGFGFLGTRASLLVDTNLVVQILFYVVLCAGVVAQRRQLYHWHDRLQIPVVVLNFFFIIFIMVVSFSQQVVSYLPERLGQTYYLVASGHAGLGTLAEVLAIYCLLAGTKILPRKIGVLRYWMWATFGVWTAAVLLGVGTYFVWYTGEAPGLSEEELAALTLTEPNAHTVVMRNFEFAPGEIVIGVGDTIVWLNQDNAPHTATGDNGAFDSGTFAQAESFSTTYTEEGVFPYYCALHGGPGGFGMAGVVRVVSAEEAAQLGPPPPPPPPPTPTPVPPAPPPALPTPVPELAAEVVGSVSFRDYLGFSDSALVSLQGIEPPPAGREYVGWLTNRAGQALSLGVIPVESDGSVAYTFISPDRVNLLSRFDGFALTAEPAGDADPAMNGEVVFSGQLPAGIDADLEQLLVASPDAPRRRSLAAGVRLQAEELLRHVYEFRSQAEARRHAEHIVNLVEGLGGPNYGDLDGNGHEENPGDGFGLLPGGQSPGYLRGASETAGSAAAAPEATDNIRFQAGSIATTADNVSQWAGQVRDLALQIIAAPDQATIDRLVEETIASAQFVLNGRDLDGNGLINAAAGEGGARHLYEHAQYLAAIGVLRGDVTQLGVVSPVDDLGQNLAAPAPEEIFVRMLDFEFGPTSLTIPAGTTITWVNLGQSLHSATFGVPVTRGGAPFDTNLLASGDQSSFTFDTPGTYPYFCKLHGTLDGQGMAGVIVVTEPGTAAVIPPTATSPPPPTVPLVSEHDEDIVSEHDE